MKSTKMKRNILGVLAIAVMTWTHYGLTGPDAALASPQTADIQVDVQSAALININQADAAQLESIKGIGPALAERIVELRQTKGGFKTLEELREVKGIGEMKYERIKNQVTL